MQTVQQHEMSEPIFCTLHLFLMAGKTGFGVGSYKNVLFVHYLNQVVHTKIIQLTRNQSVLKAK